MATSVYFDNFQNTAEQSLIEDLVIESIKIYGHDVWYCPRKINDYDTPYNEDATSSYESSYFVEMYIKNVEGFEGEGHFLSRFNIQIRDEITFTIANRVYQETIGDYIDAPRPREGDLIFMPLTGKVYVIKFAEHESVFYQMGSLQVHDLRCEMFEYSSEKLSTGVPEIDALQAKYSQAPDELDGLMRDANNNVIIDANTGRPVGVSSDWNPDDPFSDNASLQLMSDFIDWSEQDPFSEGGEY
jgi:hypothetical protein